MLQALRVQNFGAVDEVLVEPDEALTVLTGETGAGKTLLVEALHLVLGGRDRSLPVRDTDRPSRVEALFASDDGSEVVLGRELAPRGRLRATVDGATVAAQLLAERAEGLCQLQGQHEHLVLRQPDAARALLDRAGGIDDGEVRSLRARRADLLAQRGSLGGSAEERVRRIELASHEAAEIDAVSPSSPDEIDLLLDEVGQVAGILDAREAVARVVAALDADADSTSAASLLADALAELPSRLEATRSELAGLLDQTRSLAGALRRDLEQVEGDPDRLDALNDRLARLQGLVRRHGRTLEDVLARRAVLGAELDALRGAAEAAERLDADLIAVEASLAKAEADLAAARATAATALAAAVRAHLGPLALPHARFEVVVAGPAGERVGFLFAGTAAFEPAPLAEAASGGELSRVMLALTLASDAGAATMVFDEVDAGIGGATARALASCLSEAARHRQVIVVTHLATVAAVAARHLVVTRGDGPEAPASLREVVGADRVAEIARMLAGDPRDPTALAHAEALLAGDHAER